MAVKHTENTEKEYRDRDGAVLMAQHSYPRTIVTVTLNMKAVITMTAVTVTIALLSREETDLELVQPT
jgi:hypothetical protein